MISGTSGTIGLPDISTLTALFVSWKRELKILIQRKPKPESDTMNISRVLLDFLLSDINV
jgi:hypothetical protein